MTWQRRKARQPPGRLIPALLCLLWSTTLPAAAGSWNGLAGVARESALVSEAFRADLARFYAARQDRPLWFAGEHALARAGQLLTVLADAGREGLDPAAYAAADLRTLCGGDVVQEPLACELRLSDSLLRYARDVGFGALPAAQMDPYWHIPPQHLQAAALLDGMAASDDPGRLLEDLPPPHAAYRQLRAALADHRQAPRWRQWLAMPAGPSLRPGDRDGRVLALRERLAAARPELLEADDPELFDAPLAAAVEVFQARHGLNVDGIVGRRTVAALNVTPAQRIVELRLNMERWRWMPRELGAIHVLVNLPAFDLTLVQPDAPPLHMRVVAGRPDRSSPALQDLIARLVINPDWTVPRRVAVEDMLPQLQNDPLALLAKDIRILRADDGTMAEVDPLQVDWGQYHRDNFPFVLRQLPGPHNSLGRIKFDMPNPLDIYLHDTPARQLFDRQPRAFSSGCIRVEQPLQLASRLLGGDPDLAALQLRELIDRGDKQRLPLPSPVPVYLVYLTAWVDEAGNLQLRDDVYGRNARIRDRFAFP